jgi:hypothetical protein
LLLLRAQPSYCRAKQGITGKDPVFDIDLAGGMRGAAASCTSNVQGINSQGQCMLLLLLLLLAEL